MDSQQASFRLEKGATGFRDRHDPPLRMTRLTMCRTAWYAAARAARGRVGYFAEQEDPQSFHSATISDPGGMHVMLFHAYQPLIAFVAGRRYGYTDEFVEPPVWSAAFGDFGFVVLGEVQLRSPLAAADVSGLSAAELRQVSYWRPMSLGATLFNSWD
ncbi:hypothetical protein ACIHFE_34160 [Streptomyces sp. NPDC052396]|uniref:hypothetical protein n=1 Tax=Streptomyces sp. NPDC052396 TaxID=3365689 RepID=UPI0037CE6D79